MDTMFTIPHNIILVIGAFDFLWMLIVFLTERGIR